MSYYDEPYYCEPSEFDEKCEELIEMLRQSANEDIKAELEKLRKENAEMKEIFNNYNQKVRELEQAKRNYEFDEQRLRSKIESDVKKLRLSSLLEDFQTTIYTVRNVYKEKPKCDKCDEQGYLHYFTPRGKEQKEWCECREKEDFYAAEECYCHEFKISTFPDRRGQLIGWYRLNSAKYEEDCYTSSHYVANKMYQGQPFADLDNRNIYFYDEETAKQYADWLNKRSEQNAR